MQLNRFFRLEEFTRSATAARHGIDNTPTREILVQILVTAMGGAQIRELIERPLILTSGYRCAELNARVKGSPTSSHMTGQAFDGYAPGLTAMGLAQAVRDSRIAFDQVILERDRGIVHFGFGPLLRRQVLTQVGGAGTPFVPGLVE